MLIGLDQRDEEIDGGQLASMVPKNFAYASFHAVTVYRTSQNLFRHSNQNAGVPHLIVEATDHEPSSARSGGIA